MKTKIILIISFFLISTFSNSFSQQSPTVGPKGKVSGKVLDNETKKPVEYATIALVSTKDSTIVNGTVADALGQFEIKKVPDGNYVLEVSFIGYETKKQNILIAKGNENVVVENVVLSPEAKALEEVEVIGELSTIVQKVDRRVINVGKDLTTAGASASEVLNNVPSVSVDQDGNISLRGNENVRILVDGKPTNIDPAQLLKQIPSTSIKTIELITNPSAKYNPEGMSGIINITLKKNSNMGFNGNVNLGYTRGDNSRYNGSLDLNYRTGKFNFFANYGANYGKNDNNGHIDRYDNSSAGDFSFNSDNASHLLKAGLDFYINDKNTFSFYTNQSKFDGDFIGLTDYKYALNDTLNVLQNLDADFWNNTQTYNFDYKLDFEKEGHNIEFEANLSKTENDDYFDYRITRLTSRNNYNDILDRNHKNQTYNIDYVNPLSDDTKLEAGAESRIRKTYNSFVSTSENIANSVYDYNRFIHSLYATVAHKFGKFSTQLGARLESYDVEAISDGNKIYEEDYITVYPSAFITYAPNDTNSFQLSYSRRVDRPGLRQVNPIREWSTPTISSIGNPELSPQFTHSVELNYTRQIKNGSITSGIFYRRIENEISRVLYQDPEDENKLILSYDNYENNSAYGLELSSNYRFTDWWNFNASFDLYNRTLKGILEKEYLEKDETVWNIRANNDFKATKKLRFQLFGMYRGPHSNLQFDIDPMWKVDVGARLTIFDGKGTLSARYNDLFDGMKFGFVSDRPYPQSGEFHWENQTFYVGLSYRFGSSKFKKRARKYRQSGEQQGGGGGFF